MKTARFFGVKDIRIIETDVPTIGDNDVLLKVHVCGICGGDSRQYLSTTKQDKAPGHEIGAEVYQIGKNVNGLSKGDAVCVEPWVFCGECEDCLKGETNHCAYRQFMSYHLPGGFSEYIAAPAHVVHKMPSGTSYETCLLVEPLSVGVHAIRRCGMKSGETVLILGLGTIGLSAVVAARHLGAGKIIGSAKYSHQADLARKLGADMVIGSQEGEVMDAVQSHTRRGADVAVIASMGVPISLGIDALRSGGKMALYVTPSKLDESFGRAIGKEIVIYGCDAYAAFDGKRDYQVAMEILLSGKVDFSSIVTHRFPLAQAKEAFEASTNRAGGAVKVLVEMDS